MCHVRIIIEACKRKKKNYTFFSVNNWGGEIECATVIVLHCIQFKRFLTPNNSLSFVGSVICLLFTSENLWSWVCQNKRQQSLISKKWVTCLSTSFAFVFVMILDHHLTWQLNIDVRYSVSIPSNIRKSNSIEH